MAQPIVLVVDDDEDIRVSLVEYLRRSIEGVTVLGASDGKEALALMHHTPIDLLITDHYMPNVTGDRLLAKARVEQPDCVRMLMTAFPDPEVLIPAVNDNRVVKVFTKPIDPPELAARVSDALEQANAFAHANQRKALPPDLKALAKL